MQRPFTQEYPFGQGLAGLQFCAYENEQTRESNIIPINIICLFVICFSILVKFCVEKIDEVKFLFAQHFRNRINMRVRRYNSFMLPTYPTYICRYAGSSVIVNFDLQIQFLKILLFFQQYAKTLQILKIMAIVKFTLLSFFVTAQIPKNIQFKHFSEDNGLSQTVFQSILQDKKGYMWFGTRHGLMKYDGYSFTNFEVDPDNKNKLQDYDIRGICEDSSGNIWLSISSSLCKYNQHTGIFTGYHNDDHNKFSGPQGAVSCLLTDNRGQLWIGTDTGLCFYEPASDKIVNLSNIVFPDTLCSRGINCLMMDHTGMIWIGTEKGINIYDPVRKKIKFFSPGDKNYFPNSGITSMMQDHSGELWISIFNKGIYRYNPSTGDF